jgi:hypothetical protein
MEGRLERRARNEAFVREVNERLERLDKASEAEGWPPQDGLFDFHCECGGGGTACTEKVRVTVPEYESVRQQDDRFVVVPGHEDADLEYVVGRTDRFLVVDKAHEAEPFVADDPRGAPSR